MISYLFSIHIPVLQSEDPMVAVLRVEADVARVVRIGPSNIRDFHTGIMAYVARLAGQLSTIDHVPSIQAQFVFSGLSYTADAIDVLMAQRWPWDAYAHVNILPGPGQGRLVTSMSKDARHPINRFQLPRGAIISELNLVYAERGRVLVHMTDEDKAKLAEEMNVFSQRPASQVTNDPERLMEYPGEGRVIAMGVGLWHMFHARAALLDWGRDVIKAA